MISNKSISSKGQCWFQHQQWRVSLRFLTRSLRSVSVTAISSFSYLSSSIFLIFDEITNKSSRPSSFTNIHGCVNSALVFLVSGCAWPGQAHPCTFVYLIPECWHHQTESPLWLLHNLGFPIMAADQSEFPCPVWSPWWCCDLTSFKLSLPFKNFFALIQGL